MEFARRRVDALVVLGLVALAVGLSARAWSAPIEWKPDSLFYQAQLLEVRGADAAAARHEVFSGPLAAPRRDSPTVGNPHWVEYSAQFYRRRWVDPAIGAAVYPVLGDASLLAVSIGAFVLCVPVLFILLRRRWSVAASALVAAAAAFLPPFQHWSFLPLSDSTGLLLELVALLAAVVVIDRGLRWLPLWILAVAGLSVARDATFVVVAGLLWAAARHRSRRAAWLAGSGLLAALPAPLLFGAPVRVALAYTLNGFQAQADPSWGAIAHGYLRGAHSLVKNDLDYLARDPYVAVLGLGGFVLLFALRGRSDPVVSLMRASALAALGYLLLLPNYTEFRLELVLVPMIAVGIAAPADALLAASERAFARLRPGSRQRDADEPTTREQDHVADGKLTDTADQVLRA